MPTFVFKGVRCVSAGCIFYRHTNNGVELLIQYKQPHNKHKFNTVNDNIQYVLEDLGGKSDKLDQSIQDTAARESAEESNGEIFYQLYWNNEMYYKYDFTDYNLKIENSKKYIKTLIERYSTPFINKHSKYVLFLVPLPADQTELYNFGTQEIHPQYNIKRELKWVPIKEITKSPLQIFNHRIRFFIKILKTYSNNINQSLPSVVDGM